VTESRRREISKPQTTQPHNEKLTMNELYQIIRTSVKATLEPTDLTVGKTAMGSDRDARHHNFSTGGSP